MIYLYRRTFIELKLWTGKDFSSEKDKNQMKKREKMENKGD